MTFDELIAEIRWEAKLEQDDTWLTHLLLLIWDEEVQIASLQNEESLYICREAVTSASQDIGTKLVTLPPMLKLDRMEYFANSAGGVEWNLPDRDGMVAPIQLPPRPKAYEMQQGVPPSFLLAFVPPYAMQTDILYVSYWKYPAVPVGTDTIFPSSWIASLKVNCIRRAQIFNTSLSEKRAEFFAQMLAKAEAVVGKSNETLDTSKDEKGSN